MRRVCPPSARRRCIALAPLVLLLLAMALVLPSAARATTRPHVIVSLTFDDGFESVWSARPILQQYDMHATFYLNSGLLNRTGRLTDAQVRELAADGDEIGGHTVQHLHLPSLDPAEAKRQICNDRVALAGITGRAPTDFAYPFSETSPAVDADVAACGYNSGRLVGGISSQHCGPTCPYAETIPPAKPYALRTGVSVVPSTSVTAPEAQITAALHHGGGWVILVFHNYCDGCSGISVNPATFKTLLAWLHKMQSQGVQVQTVHQVIGGPTRTLVEGPPPRSGATVLMGAGHVREQRRHLRARAGCPLWEVGRSDQRHSVFLRGRQSDRRARHRDLFHPGAARVHLPPERVVHGHGADATGRVLFQRTGWVGIRRELVVLGPLDGMAPDHLDDAPRSGWGRTYELRPRARGGRTPHGR